MLHRRSIRTKLIYALVILTITFSFLTLSAVWGVDRYRRLADSVRQQAVEIPYANSIHLHAQTIRRSHARLTKLSDQKDRFDNSLFSASQAVQENHAVDVSFITLELDLEKYQDEIEASSDQARMLVDVSDQLVSLAKIRDIKDEMDKLRAQPSMMTLDGNKQFAILATKLVEASQSHLDLIHTGMTKFSEDVSGHYRGWMTLTVCCMAAALALVMILWLSFKSLIAKPFRTLLDGSRLVAAGQYGHRIDLGTSDELSELAEAMNCMSTRFRDVYDRQKMTNADLDRQVQERTREVIQNEQLASVGFLAAGVAHEINNPLASIAWSAESLQTETDDVLMSGKQLDPEYQDSLQTNLQRIQCEAYRCKGITERLLDFSRLGDISRSTVDLGELVRDVVAMVGKVGKYKCSRLRVHCDEEVVAHVNAQEIRQVVLNLVTNALESVCDEGAVDVHVRNCNEQAYVSVVDNGCGMSQEVLAHLFEPFFTRRRDGTGTGLGLSITYRIVSQHHGSLVASSEGEGKGSQMEMWLPISAVSDDEAEQRQLFNGWNHDTGKVAQ